MSSFKKKKNIRLEKRLHMGKEATQRKKSFMKSS